MGCKKLYNIGDVLTRYKILKILMFYIQWDGIHLVCQQGNAAKQNNLNPKKWTESNIRTMKSQLKY